MILAVDDPVVFGGGAVILVGLLIRTVASDVTWRNLIFELREELKTARKEREDERLACAQERGEWRTEKTEYESKVRSLEGEVFVLRRQMQTDQWLGISPVSRSRLYDQEQGE